MILSNNRDVSSTDEDESVITFQCASLQIYEITTHKDKYIQHAISSTKN